MVRSLVICIYITKYFSGNQIKKKELGKSCSTYGVEENCIQGFGWES